MLRTFLRHPLLWLLIGPPVLRFGGSRDPGATLMGSYDVWIFLQIALYFAAGTCALLVLLAGRRRGATAFDNQGFVQFLAMSFCLIATLSLSSLYSPNFLLTVVYSTLFLMALVALVEFGFNASRPGNGVSIVALYKLLRGISVAALVLVIVVYFIDPDQVATASSPIGVRLMGGKVGSVPLLAVTIYCISVHFFINNIDKRMTTAVYIVFALACVGLSQTKTAYAVTALITLHGVWIWLAASRVTTTVFPRLAVVTAGVLAIGLFVVSELQQVIAFILRGDVSLEKLSTASGRTFIFGWVLGRAVEEPMGIGYVAGFRTEFRKLGGFEFRGLLPANIGDAHNTFMEYLIGGGWAALIFYVLVIVITFRCLKNVSDSTTTDGHFVDLAIGRNITFILLWSYILMSLTSSEFGIPARSSFSYLWFVVGMALLIRLRLWYARRAAPYEYPVRA